MSSLLHLNQIISSTVSEHRECVCAPAAGCSTAEDNSLFLLRVLTGKYQGHESSSAMLFYVQFQLQAQWTVFKARAFKWVKHSSSQKQIIIQYKCGTVIRKWRSSRAQKEEKAYKDMRRNQLCRNHPCWYLNLRLAVSPNAFLLWEPPKL